MLRRFLILLPAALAAAAITVGCGDEDSGASAGGNADITTSSLSKEQFIERANDLCKRRNEQLSDEIAAYIRKNQKEIQGASPLEASSSLAELALSAFQETIDTLRELGAPDGDEDELAALLAEMQRGVDTLERRLPKQATGLDPDAEFFQVFNSSAAMARRYGIEACALS